MASAHLSDVLNESQSDKEEEKDKDYEDLLALFVQFLDTWEAEDDPMDIAEAIMELRAEIAIRCACKGFGMELEEALTLVKKKEGLTELESSRRDVLVAAINNMIDFAVVAEYQMFNALPIQTQFSDDEYEEDINWEEEGIDPEEIEEADYDHLLAIFALYNRQYATVEHKDVEFAMKVAAAYIAFASSTTLTYMTQGDERVRPWHLQYEGYSAPKYRFPGWLIPPIEHQCRCYLVEDTSGDVDVDSDTPEMPSWFNPTFKESVAQGGRIFSDEHPYFTVAESQMERLDEISNRIRSKYF